VFNSRFWKEHCFALNSESLVEKAMTLEYVGFAFGAFHRPTPFLCLLVKMVQILPSIEMLRTYVEFSAAEPSNNVTQQESDMRYLRVLTAVYIRLVCRPEMVYSMLEPLFQDYRTVVLLDTDAKFSKVYIDEFVETLLAYGACSIQGFHFPHLTRRSVLHAKGLIGEYISSIEDELEI
jgi:pre-mRNA-splicing factor 38A